MWRLFKIFFVPYTKSAATGLSGATALLECLALKNPHYCMPKENPRQKLHQVFPVGIIINLFHLDVFAVFNLK